MSQKLVILIHTSVKLVTTLPSGMFCMRSNFNPHEREARDATAYNYRKKGIILIHTSVKLVTIRNKATEVGHIILIHTSVKLVTKGNNKR